jgi:chromosome segregation ATPase
LGGSMSKLEELENVLVQMSDEDKTELAFILLRHVTEKRKLELEKQLDELREQEQVLENHLSLVEKKLQEFMPSYERISRYVKSLEYGQTVVRKRLQNVRDKINLTEGKFKNYITRLENILKSA